MTFPGRIFGRGCNSTKRTCPSLLFKISRKVSFANPLRGDRMLQQLFRERDLISVGDQSVVESKIEIIALQFRRDARGGVADPFSQRRKFILPELSEPSVCRRETNRPAQVFP